MNQLSLEALELHNDIATRGFALIEHGIPNELVDQLIADYADFTDNFPEPELATLSSMITDLGDLDMLDYGADNQAEWHKYRTNTPQFAKPNGYTNRSLQATALHEVRGIEIAEDPKEYFHYTPGMRERLKDAHARYGWGSVPSEVSTLLSRFHTVHKLAKEAMSSTFASLEETHPELPDFTTPEDLDMSPVRLLFYHHGQGNVLAGGHYDRGTATMQLAESHLGFRARGPYGNDMNLLDREARYGVFFPAIKWKVGMPESELAPLWHDVVNEPDACRDRTMHGQNVARWALIFFTNSEKIGEHQDKSETHSEMIQFDRLKVQKMLENRYR